MLNLDHIAHFKEAAKRDPRYHRFTKLPAIDMSRMIRSLPLAKQCIHLGANLTIEEGKEHADALLALGVKCTTCTGKRSEYHCSKFKFTNMGKCTACREWTPNHTVFSRPAIKFDHTNLCPDAPGARFNCSIIESGDGYLFVYRHGWGGSDLYAVRLDRQFHPISDAKLLGLKRAGAGFGREDGRLFRVAGQLFIMYIGVAKKYGPVNVLYAMLDEDTLEVVRDSKRKLCRWNPDVPGRVPESWEKNWAFFDHDGVAHAVYSINPHRIARLQERKMEFVYETTARFSWSGGRLSGGASPVLHNGEWYHFFHGSTEWNGRRQYNMGCYTFRPHPPFQITRFTPHPIDVADPTVSHDNGCDVLFPGGAMLIGNDWVIAHGIHDRYSEIRFYSASWVEEQLEPVK